MNHKDMISTSLAVEVQPVAHAPTYGEDVKMVRLAKAVVVPKGTVNGKPTVDLQLVDADGNKYLIMATGAIMTMISKIVIANGGE